MLNHIAVLVPSVTNSTKTLTSLGYACGEISDFPSEGTREVYVGPSDASGSLLLMEATGPGPYDRARRKRGYGLHHVAIDVDDPASFAIEMGGAGWLLHPRSLKYLSRGGPLFMVRPGVGAVIEVLKRQNSTVTARAFITKVNIRCEPALAGLPGALKASEVCGCDGPSAIWVQEKPFSFDLLLT